MIYKILCYFNFVSKSDKQKSAKLNCFPLLLVIREPCIQETKPSSRLTREHCNFFSMRYFQTANFYNSKDKSSMLFYYVLFCTVFITLCHDVKTIL